MKKFLENAKQCPNNLKTTKIATHLLLKRIYSLESIVTIIPEKKDANALKLQP